MRRPAGSKRGRSSPRRGHSYLRLLHRKRDSWGGRTKRASVGREQNAICTFDCRVDIRRHVSPLRATIQDLIELSVNSSKKKVAYLVQSGSVFENPETRCA